MEKLIDLYMRAEERRLTLTLTRKGGKWYLALYSKGTLLLQTYSAQIEDTIGMMANYLRGISFIDVQA